MQKITVLLVDNHRLFREALACVLNEDHRVSVIGETSNLDNALKIVANTRPNIVLSDINMSPFNGFEFTKKVKELSPETKILGLSGYALPAYMKKMFKAGAYGYVTKNSSQDELLKGILALSHGEKKFICREIQDILAGKKEKSDNTPFANLTSTEMGIVQLIREGFSSSEIAQQLHVGSRTIDAHRYNISRKLNLKNAAALVNYAHKQGW